MWISLQWKWEMIVLPCNTNVGVSHWKNPEILQDAGENMSSKLGAHSALRFLYRWYGLLVEVAVSWAATLSINTMFVYAFTNCLHVFTSSWSHFTTQPIMGWTMQLLCFFFVPKAIEHCRFLPLHFCIFHLSSSLHVFMITLHNSNYHEMLNAASQFWFLCLPTGVNRKLQGSSRSTFGSLPQATGSLRLFFLFVVHLIVKWISSKAA